MGYKVKFKFPQFDRRTAIIFSFIIFTMFIGYIGATMNEIAIKTNDCRMPVKWVNFYYESDTHFSYSNNSEVNNWWLTDIIDLAHNTWSIGDFLMILSGVFLTVFIVLLFVRFPMEM